MVEQRDIKQVKWGYIKENVAEPDLSRLTIFYSGAAKEKEEISKLFPPESERNIQGLYTIFIIGCEQNGTPIPNQYDRILINVEPSSDVDKIIIKIISPWKKEDGYIIAREGQGLRFNVAEIQGADKIAQDKYSWTIAKDSEKTQKPFGNSIKEFSWIVGLTKDVTEEGKYIIRCFAHDAEDNVIATDEIYLQYKKGTGPSENVKIKIKEPSAREYAPDYELPLEVIVKEDKAKQIDKLIWFISEEVDEDRIKDFTKVNAKKKATLLTGEKGSWKIENLEERPYSVICYAINSTGSYLIHDYKIIKINKTTVPPENIIIKLIEPKKEEFQPGTEIPLEAKIVKDKKKQIDNVIWSLSEEIDETKLKNIKTIESSPKTIIFSGKKGSWKIPENQTPRRYSIVCCAVGASGGHLIHDYKIILINSKIKTEDVEVKIFKPWTKTEKNISTENGLTLNLEAHVTKDKNKQVKDLLWYLSEEVDEAKLKHFTEVKPLKVILTGEKGSWEIEGLYDRKYALVCRAAGEGGVYLTHDYTFIEIGKVEVEIKIISPWKSKGRNKLELSEINPKGESEPIVNPYKAEIKKGRDKIKELNWYIAPLEEDKTILDSLKNINEITIIEKLGTGEKFEAKPKEIPFAGDYAIICEATDKNNKPIAHDYILGEVLAPEIKIVYPEKNKVIDLDTPNVERLTCTATNRELIKDYIWECFPKENENNRIQLQITPEHDTSFQFKYEQGFGAGDWILAVSPRGHDNKIIEDKKKNDVIGLRLIRFKGESREALNLDIEVDGKRYDPNKEIFREPNTQIKIKVIVNSGSGKYDFKWKSIEYPLANTNKKDELIVDYNKIETTLTDPHQKTAIDITVLDIVTKAVEERRVLLQYNVPGEEPEQPQILVEGIGYPKDFKGPFNISTQIKFTIIGKEVEAVKWSWNAPENIGKVMIAREKNSITIDCSRSLSLNREIKFNSKIDSINIMAEVGYTSSSKKKPVKVSKEISLIEARLATQEFDVVLMINNQIYDPSRIYRAEDILKIQARVISQTPKDPSKYFFRWFSEEYPLANTAKGFALALNAGEVLHDKKRLSEYKKKLDAPAQAKINVKVIDTETNTQKWKQITLNFLNRSEETVPLSIVITSPVDNQKFYSITKPITFSLLGSLEDRKAEWQLPEQITKESIIEIRERTVTLDLMKSPRIVATFEKVKQARFVITAKITDTRTNQEEKIRPIKAIDLVGPLEVQVSINVFGIIYEPEEYYRQFIVPIKEFMSKKVEISAVCRGGSGKYSYAWLNENFSDLQAGKQTSKIAVLRCGTFIYNSKRVLDIIKEDPQAPTLPEIIDTITKLVVLDQETKEEYTEEIKLKFTKLENKDVEQPKIIIEKPQQTSEVYNVKANFRFKIISLIPIKTVSWELQEDAEIDKELKLKDNKTEVLETNFSLSPTLMQDVKAHTRKTINLFAEVQTTGGKTYPCSKQIILEPMELMVPPKKPLPGEDGPQKIETDDLDKLIKYLLSLSKRYKEMKGETLARKAERIKQLEELNAEVKAGRIKLSIVDQRELEKLKTILKPFDASFVRGLDSQLETIRIGIGIIKRMQSGETKKDEKAIKDIIAEINLRAERIERFNMKYINYENRLLSLIEKIRNIKIKQPIPTKEKPRTDLPDKAGLDARIIFTDKAGNPIQKKLKYPNTEPIYLKAVITGGSMERANRIITWKSDEYPIDKSVENKEILILNPGVVSKVLNEKAGKVTIGLEVADQVTNEIRIPDPVDIIYLSSEESPDPTIILEKTLDITKTGEKLYILTAKVINGSGKYTCNWSTTDQAQIISTNFPYRIKVRRDSKTSKAYKAVISVEVVDIITNRKGKASIQIEFGEWAEGIAKENLLAEFKAMNEKEKEIRVLREAWINKDDKNLDLVSPKLNEIRQKIITLFEDTINTIPKYRLLLNIILDSYEKITVALERGEEAKVRDQIGIIGATQDQISKEKWNYIIKGFENTLRAWLNAYDSEVNKSKINQNIKNLNANTKEAELKILLSRWNEMYVYYRTLYDKVVNERLERELLINKMDEEGNPFEDINSHYAETEEDSIKLEESLKEMLTLIQNSIQAINREQAEKNKRW